MSPFTGLDYWTGLLDWNTGLDYWTEFFSFFGQVSITFLKLSDFKIAVKVNDSYYNIIMITIVQFTCSNAL